jgi:hypothetical protein
VIKYYYSVLGRAVWPSLTLTNAHYIFKSFNFCFFSRPCQWRAGNSNKLDFLEFSLKSNWENDEHDFPIDTVTFHQKISLTQAC